LVKTKINAFNHYLNIEMKGNDMKKAAYIIGCGICCAIFMNCSSGKLLVKKFQPGTIPSGIVYALPKTLLKVEIPYTIDYHEEFDNGEKKYMPKCKADRGDISVNTVITPDENAYYEIQNDNNHSPLWQNAFSVELTKDGYLSSSSTAYEDRTLNTAIAAVKIVGAIIKPAGKGNEKDINTFNELDSLGKSFKNIELSYVNVLKKECSTLQELENNKKQLLLLKDKSELIEQRITDLKVRNKKIFGIKLACVFEPDKMQISDDYIYQYTINESNCSAIKEFKKTFKNIPVLPFPESFWIGLKNKMNISSTQSDKPMAPEKSEEAYVYRIPLLATYEIRENAQMGEILATGDVRINQFGVFGKIFVNRKRFSKNKYSIELHEETGNLKKYSVTSEGNAAENAATGSKEIISEIQRMTKNKTESEKLNEENDLLKAKIDKIKNEKTLKELQIDE
jgi:hypothetical protein